MMGGAGPCESDLERPDRNVLEKKNEENRSEDEKERPGARQNRSRTPWASLRTLPLRIGVGVARKYMSGDGTVSVFVQFAVSCCYTHYVSKCARI